MHRRRFLKNAGAALAAPLIIPAPALGKGGTTAPSNRVTLAQIGTGWQGTNNLLAFLDEPQVRVVAGQKDVRFGTKWIGEGGWIWAERSGLEAQPQKVLTSRIGPNEIQLPRSPGHYTQSIDCIKTRQTTLTPPDVALRSATPGCRGGIALPPDAQSLAVMSACSGGALR